MRWIFLTLVFGNLLLLGYFWQQQNTAPITATAAPVDVPGGGKQLQMVSELAQPLPATNQQKNQPDRATLCYVAGPFADEIDARHLQARSQALGFSGRLSVVEISSDEPAEFWVYVPPRASREAALRTLRELQNRKFDSYIITQGELAEGVSLGLFRNQERAYGLQKSVAAFDIPVEVKVVNKTVREHWVEIVETAQLNEPMRDRIRASDSQIRWELVECKKG